MQGDGRNVVTTFEANQVKPQERLRDRRLALMAGPLVMRLCKNDLIASRKTASAASCRQFGWDRVTLAEHKEANTRERNDDKATLSSTKLRRISSVRAKSETDIYRSTRPCSRSRLQTMIGRSSDRRGWAVFVRRARIPGRQP